MAHLTLSASTDGFALEVLMGLPGQVIAALQASGTPIPIPLRVRGLLDTGSDVTAVTPRVVQQLNLIPALVPVSTQTAAGMQTVRVFQVSLSLAGPPGSPGPLLVRPDLVVTELPQSLPNIDVLIGLDVLAECLLISDGPGRQFILGA